MPEPEVPPMPPVPDAPATFSREWWLRQLMLILPTNWRQIVQYLIVICLITLINWIRGDKSEPLPFPEPPFDIFMVVPEGSNIDDATLKEMEKRGVKVRFCGWKPPTPEEKKETLSLLLTPKWEDTDASGFGDGPEDDAPLWRMFAKVTGSNFAGHDQGQIGSCVSFGTSLALEVSLCAKINGKRGPPQQFSPTVREAIYGGSRINADPQNPIRDGDGSTGSRAAKWGQKGIGGALPVGNYGPYSVTRCREWGNRGVTGDALVKCKENPYQSTLVTSAEAARQAIQQGYAIFVCSDQGFSMTRDSEGFLKPQGTWMHCMAICGYRGDARKGFLIVNSWGPDWVKGPTGKFADIPPGSFWADVTTVDRMLRQQDSYAVSDIEGFRRRKINPEDWIVQRRPGVAPNVFALR